jgi:four helix bundle protein
MKKHYALFLMDNFQLSVDNFRRLQRYPITNFQGPQETPLKENIVLEKAYQFALHVVELYRKLTEERHEYILSKNLLNDGTNIGAYIESAQETENGMAFSREMSIALQKAGRTKYWLNVLHDGRFIGSEEYRMAYEECAELRRLLGKIIKTTRGHQHFQRLSLNIGYLPQSNRQSPINIRTYIIGHWILGIVYCIAVKFMLPAPCKTIDNTQYPMTNARRC